eukprot:g25108.t1
MSTHMGPSYDCVFVGYVEQFLFRSYTGTIPHLFLCYIDDCIGAALCSHEQLEQFINFTTTFHPNLKFTWTITDTSLSFLDLSVSLSGDQLETDIYFKPTNSHSYLDYTSSYSPFCKNAIPYSQFLQLRLDRSLCNSLICYTLPTNPTNPGTFPYNRRKCYTCSFTSPLTSIQDPKQIFHIRQGFTCTSVNLVYCIHCSRC